MPYRAYDQCISLLPVSVDNMRQLRKGRGQISVKLQIYALTLFFSSAVTEFFSVFCSKKFTSNLQYYQPDTCVVNNLNSGTVTTKIFFCILLEKVEI